MALVDRLVREMVEDDRRAGQIVEQRVEPLVVEGQPVLHAGEAAALADRGVEAVVARRRAERLDVVAAEAADRIRRQRHFGHRLQRDFRARACGALCRDVEGTHRLQRVAEEVEPDSLLGAWREKVEDAAAHRELADVAHGRHALEAGGFQPRNQRVHVDVAARPGAKALRLDDLGRRDALESRVGGGQDHGAVRRLAECCHRRQRVEAAGCGVGARRDAVVRQAVPGREFEHRQVGRDEGERLDDDRQALAVARDEEQRPVGRGLGYRRGEREGLKAVGDAVDDELAGSAFRQADFFKQAHRSFFRSPRPGRP